MLQVKRKPFPGFERYEFTSSGKVFMDGVQQKGYCQVGYRAVYLYADPGDDWRSDRDRGSNRANEDGRSILVHRGVAMLFLPNPKKYPFVNHKDGNRTNNHVENLEWVSPSINTKHAHENGLIKQFKRPVDQYNTKGKYISTFESAVAAAKFLGLPGSYGISKVCNKVMVTCGGYKWAFTGEAPGGERPILEIDPKEWKVIHYGKGKYYVSQQGEVLSLKGKNKRFYLMTPTYASYDDGKGGKRRGYMKVHLRDSTNQYKPHWNVAIHRLVAMAWIPKIDGKYLINHIDGDGTNNCSNNLEWCTSKENTQKAVETGLIPPPEGKKIDRYDQTGKFIKSYDSIKEASKELDIDRASIEHAVSYRRNLAGGWIFRPKGKSFIPTMDDYSKVTLNKKDPQKDLATKKNRIKYFEKLVSKIPKRADPDIPEDQYPDLLHNKGDLTKSHQSLIIKPKSPFVEQVYNRSKTAKIFITYHWPK